MEPSASAAQAVSVLEWDRLLEILAGYARSTVGVERCRKLVPETDLDRAKTRLQETAEMVLLRQSSSPFPSISCPDVRQILGRVAKGAVLDAHELRDVSVLLAVALDVERSIERHRLEVPTLTDLAGPLLGMRQFDRLKDTIDRCVDEEGHIKESATAELRRLSSHAHELKQTMRRRLDMILASDRYADVLQERYFAQCEGRYVVPIKADMRAKIPGIVHDVSSSGATVFLEPRELVDLNNAIKVAELEVDREVHRILQGLSSDLARHADSLRHAAEALADLDCVAAKAALSDRINGRPVSLSPVGRIALRQARHPLLVLTKDQVVPNDIRMDESVRVLIISGPNTGGKTVTLKILGLFALMVRAGLQPSCGADSEMGFFPEVFADIGDAQDLAKSLSSFSAHMTHMIDLLAHASTVGRDMGAQALVLLDEPVTSTDPAEGAALAEALLLRLARLGMKVVATTHYNSLKVLAQTTPGFLNASVGFDVATLSPTYRLMLGVPRGSAAIDIAGRLGMDEAILDEALQLVRREDRAVERMLGDLQEKQRRLEEDEARMAALRRQIEQSSREAREVAERLSAGERDERKRMKKKWADELLQARTQIQAILDTLKKEQTVERAKEAKRRLAELNERTARVTAAADDRPPLERLAVGGVVEIVGLHTTGTLLEAPAGKKRVRVRVGDREMSVAVSSLQPSVEQPEAALATASAPFRPLSGPSLSDATSTVLDLRGKTADQAVEETMAALDRAMLAGTPIVRLIHGHGTGRLKTSLREYLKGSPYVAGFRPGERAEGGDGVTIVQLR